MTRTQSLPAFTRTERIQRHAAAVGFDWPDASGVLSAVIEELDELEREMTAGAGHEQLENEFGDVLFGLINLARHLGIDPESALQRTNAKFETRFRHVEERLAQGGRTPAEATLAEMDQLWNEAKNGSKDPRRP